MRSSISYALTTCALVALVACGDKQEQPPPPAPPPKPVRGLAAIPADATAVVGFDVRAIAASPLAAELASRAFDGAPELTRRLRAVLAACAIDVGRDVEQLLFATGREPTQALMVVDGAVDATRLPSCVGQAVASAGGTVAVVREAPRTVWATRHPDGSPAVWFAMGAPRSLVASISEGWLEAALADGGKLAADERADAVLRRVDREAAAWLFGRVDRQLAGRFSALAGGPGSSLIEYVYGRLRLSQDVDLELAAVLPRASDAAAVAEFVRGQLETAAVVAQGAGLGGVVSRIRVDVEKDTVFLRLTLSAEDLKETISQIDRAAGGE